MALEDFIQFFMPTRVYYESDSFHKMASVLKSWGNRIVLVSVKNELPNVNLLYEIRSNLEKDFESVIFYDDVEKLPDSDDLDTASYYARQTDADIIVGVGGIESLNMAKALSMMINNEGFCSEFLAGERRPTKASLPCVTMPLLPTFGTEIAPNFILLDAEDKVKKIFSHDNIFPALAYIDPKFTLDLGVEQTAASGAAIIAASVETFISKNANDITNTLALRSIELIFRSLPKLIPEGSSIPHRNSISLASLLAGMGYANSSLGTCLAMSMAINSITGIQYDLLMAILLPHIMEYNLTATPGKYVQIARIIDNCELKDITVIEAAIKAVEGIRKLYSEIGIPNLLSDLKIDKGIFPNVGQIASAYSFLKDSPRYLNKEEMETLLIAAF